LRSRCSSSSAVFATPLETLALNYLLTAHFLQNVTVAEWAPALLVLSLPPQLARRVHVPMIPALVLWLGTYFIWHAPAAYDFALRHPHAALHLEHATYLIAGAALWWPVIHGRENSGAKAAYLFAAFVLASPLGLLLALLPDPVYAFYEARPTVWGLSHILDQADRRDDDGSRAGDRLLRRVRVLLHALPHRGRGCVPAAVEQRAHAFDARAAELEHLVVGPRVTPAERVRAKTTALSS
jgi:hypothetical protein